MDGRRSYVQYRVPLVLARYHGAETNADLAMPVPTVYTAKAFPAKQHVDAGPHPPPCPPSRPVLSRTCTRLRLEAREGLHAAQPRCQPSQSGHHGG